MSLFDDLPAPGASPRAGLFDDLPEAEQDGPLTRGFKRAINSGRTAYNLAAGDAETGAALAAERADYARKNPGSPEGNELMAAWERGDGVAGGIKEVAGEVAKDWTDAPNVMSAVRATGKNLGAMGGGILEQMPNMVAPMAGMLAGGAAGSLAGPAGTVGGAFAGATAGNTAMEAAEQVDRAIRQAGINPEDKEAVKAYLAANGDTVLGQAATKGAIIGAIDTATMGAGHLLLSAPGKAAAGRALEGMGVDLADRAAVKAAMASDDFAARVASDTAYQASQKGLPSLARNATVAALEPAGEFTGEYLGQGAATGDWDTKGAALEALSSVGQGAVTFAGQKLYEAATSPLRGKEAPPVQSPGDVDQANADLGFAAGQYSDLIPSEQRLLGSQPSVIAVPTQDGGTTTIDRNTGPLSDIAVDVVQGQIQTGMPLRAYATAMDAQEALDQRPDGERMRVAPHPRASGRYAVVPKTAEALTAIDRKAEAQMKSEERLATVESEDGNASQVATTGGQGSGTVAGGSAGDSQSVGGVAGGRGAAAGTSASGRGTDTSLGDASVGDAALDELAPAPVQPVSSMPAAERIKAERQAAARAEAQARGAQLTDDEVASANTEPTEAQQAAGNYQKGHVKIGSLDISIENPAGSVRSGKEGKKSWSVQMSDHYGYIKRTEGADGEQVDVYVKAGTATDHNGPVFVVDQYNPKTGQFDEHKAFVGYRTALDVTRAYDAHFSDGTGPKRRKGITKMAPDVFTAWARHGDTSQAADQAQLEIAQSTGKESKKRSNGDLYQAAAEANKRKQERRLPTEQNDTLAVREATGAEVSVVSEKDLPEADAAPTGHVSRQTAEFSRHVAKLFGKRVVFVEGMPADGFYNHGNTIYLSTTGSVHHLRLLGHEMLHALRSQSKETYAKLLEAVRDVVTDAQLKSQFRDYFSQDKGKKDWTDDQITEWLADDKNRDFLTEEWMADLSGNRWTEAGFWEDVFTQVESKYGSEQAKGIIAKLRLALVTALNKLKTLVRGSAFAVDGRVAEHLDQIRAALATGFADYAKAVKDGQAVDRDAGGVKFSKSKPTTFSDIKRGQKIEQAEPLSEKQWAQVREIALEELSKKDGQRALDAERDYLANEALANRDSERYKEVAREKLGSMAVPQLSTVPVMEGKVRPTIVGTGKNNKTRVFDVARVMRKRILARAADISNPEGRERIARALVHEALYSLSMDGHAVGWYDRKVREALAVTAMAHPEILTNKEANLAFRIIAAVTSNGQAVRDNFILANEIYKAWRSSGQFPVEFEGGGTRAPAMKAAFAKMNILIQDMGFAETERELMTMRSVREIEQEFDLKINGELKDAMVPTAVGLGGPKIGNFFANLSGYFDSPTMDLWFMRTIGRMTGGIIATKPGLVKYLDNLLALLPDSGEVKGVSVAKMRKEIAEYKALSDEQRLDPEITIKVLGQVEKYGRAQYAEFAAPDADGKTFTKKTPENENARALKSNLSALVEAPSNGTQRDQLRQVVNRALSMLDKNGIKLNAADLQAVLWYYEKNLYAKLGDVSESAKPWDYASAARFGVGREYGLVDVGSSKRAGQVRDGQPGVLEDDAGGVSEEVQEPAEKFSKARINFEVAPNPDDVALTNAWNNLSENKRHQLSVSIATDISKRAMRLFGVTGTIKKQQGGFEEETNTSFQLILDQPEKTGEVQNFIGYVLSQKSMVAVSEEPFPGSEKTGVVTVNVGDADPQAIYRQLRGIRVDGNQPVSGHSTAGGQMAILNFSEVSTEELARLIDSELRGKFDLYIDEVYTSFPEAAKTEDYGYDNNRQAREAVAGQPPLQGDADNLRRTATELIRKELKFSPARYERPAGSGVDSGLGRQGDRQLGRIDVTGVHYSREKRDRLTGVFFGSGTKAEEASRILSAKDSRLKSRLYAYVDEGQGVFPESGVGSYAHTVKFDNLYDIKADPLGIRQKTQDANDRESMILDAGFDGYYAPGVFGRQGVAILMGKAAINGVTPADTKAPAVNAAEAPKKRTDLPLGRMTGAEWKKLEPRATELEDDKSYYRDQVRFSPSRFDAIAEAFADRARKALANPRNTQPVLIHSNTPASMQILGWSDRKLIVEASELAKIANKPGFETDEKIGDLVLDLARPGAMFWNDKQGSLNILRREDMRGAPALIAVRPGVPMGIDRAHLMVTAHRLENQEALLRKITSGELKPLYLDQANPLIKQAMQTRKYRVSTLDLLAPENLHARASVQLDTSSRLLSEADLVKWERDNWGDAPKFSPARLTEARIDRLMSKYAYTMDDKKSKAYIAWVRPDAYLAATTIPGRERAQLESEKRPLDKDGLRNEYQEIFLLGKFDPENGWWKTTGHEGRHRMMALRDAGITKVPVVFGAYEGERREPIGNLFVTPQRWGEAKAERGFFAANLIPINYENLERIKTEFGGDAAVKFSPARAQTETPEFKKWYEGSNLRNADGSPMVLYHGTNKDFSRFDISKTGAMGPGVYLGDDPEVANAYAGGTGANVMPVYARGRYIGNREWSSYVSNYGWEEGRKKAIKDGVAGVWDQKFESAVLVFDPANIKSAIGNNGQFDPTNPDIRYSPSRWYFSPLQRAFEQAPDRVFSTAPQVKAWLSSNAGKLGVKQDEIQWSGITDWLDLQGKQKVSKDQVLQYLANNGVQVEEVEKGKAGYNEDDPALPEGRDLKVVEADEEYHGRLASRYKYVVIDEVSDTTKGWGNSEAEAIADAHSGHPEYWEGQDATQYSQYVLPGGKNYRELLLTLPEKYTYPQTPVLTQMEQKRMAELGQKMRRDGNLPATEMAEWRKYKDQQDAYQQELDDLSAKGKNQNPYRSPHWGEDNVLAHVRFNDRTDAEGNRVLFVEELQSDWGQAGKKKGFDPVEKVEGLSKTGVPLAPFITDTKAWVSLAVKRMIAYAVENGYDKVAFVNGQQSADRYDLSKKIDTLYAGMSVDGQYLIGADGKGGRDIIDKKVTKEELPRLVGEELADRIIADVTDEGTNAEYRGTDLKVGGEGMKIFYDKIVPQTVSDVLKKVGGGKLETVSLGEQGDVFFAIERGGKWFIGTMEDGELAFLNTKSNETSQEKYYGTKGATSFKSKESAEEVVSTINAMSASGTEVGKQTGFTITPAMREQVSRGLPLFSLARKVSNAVDSTLGKLDAAVDGLSNLPGQFDYLRDRYLALGKIARVDEISTEVRKAFDGAAPADKQAVYDYLTTRGATTGRISDHKLRSIAKRIKDTINYTGDQLVARGLLDQEARDHYRDQYLPRMYLRHMLDDQAFKVIGMGKKPSDMGYLKHRKDIPQEIRDVVLGEIKDPSFLSVNAIGRAMRDVSLLDWMGKIAQNNDWVFPEIFVPWQGKKVTAYWLRAEADRIENQSPHYTPANKTKADALVAQMRSTAHQALGSMSAIDHKKFKQIPDTRRYGLLRGMWVRTEIYNDIMGASQIVNADPTWFEDWFGFGGKGTRLTQWWKFTKVAANPPGQIRNFISNMVMLQLSGIGLHRLPFALIEAARDITNNGKYWQVAKKYGVTESTFTAQELFRVKRDLVEMEAQKGKLSSLRWLMSAGARFFEGVSDLYQFSEALGKTIKIMEEMKAGKSEAEAAIEAQKWLFDYSLVPQSVRIARNAPVGMPFLCVSDDTEILTKGGWRNADTVKVGDWAATMDTKTGRLTWRLIDDVYRSDYDGEMIHVKDRHLDMLMTPNHGVVTYRSRRVPGKRATGEKYMSLEVVHAENLTTGDHIPVAAPFDHVPDGEPISDALVEVLGWYATEGHEHNKCDAVFISQNEGAKAIRIRHALTEAGITFRENTNQRDACIQFYIHAEHGRHLRALCPGKQLPAGLLQRMSVAQIALLVQTMIDGDGHTSKNGRQVFIQKDNETLDTFLAALTLIGKSWNVRPHGSGTKAVLIKEADRYCVKRATRDRVQYKGRIWCPEVIGTGTWVARRNGKVFITHNTYQVKVLPRLLEVAAKHPWRFLPWAGLLYGMQAAVASLFGVDDDELKKLKKSLPEWLQDRGHTVFLPFRDADGRLQVADVGYFFPWTFYSQTGKHVADGKVKKALVDDVGGQFSAPILGAAAALMANYDTFTKQPIYKETDPVGYQAAAIANYAYDLMAPPFISSHGVVSPMGLVDTKFGGKLTQALAGTTNRFGDPKATEEQALGAMLGFNFYGMDPEHTRVTNLKVMEFKVHEAEKGLKQRLMDKGLSSEQRLEAIRDYRERMSELQQEMLEYAKESQVPEQLKAKKR